MDGRTRLVWEEPFIQFSKGKLKLIVLTNVKEGVMYGHQVVGYIERPLIRQSIHFLLMLIKQGLD